jgi:hypothetical protein
MRWPGTPQLKASLHMVFWAQTLRLLSANVFWPNGNRTWTTHRKIHCEMWSQWHSHRGLLVTPSAAITHLSLGYICLTQDHPLAANPPLYVSPVMCNLQGDLVNCNLPVGSNFGVWLLWLPGHRGVDPSPFVLNTQFYFTRSSMLFHKPGIVWILSLYTITQWLACLLIVWLIYARFPSHIFSSPPPPPSCL